MFVFQLNIRNAATGYSWSSFGAETSAIPAGPSARLRDARLAGEVCDAECAKPMTHDDPAPYS